MPSHMAARLMNVTNRQGIQSYNIGTLSTRPGYADRPDYQLRGKADANEFSFSSRMFAKFFPGVAGTNSGKEVDFTGSGSNDLTINTAATDSKIYEFTISGGSPTVDFTGSGLNDLTANTAPTDGKIYEVVISKGLPIVEFAGTGNNDLTVNDPENIDGVYLITITYVDVLYSETLFKWSKDGGTETTDVHITGEPQTIGAISITFAAVMGHVVDDTFTIQADEFGWASGGVTGGTNIVITGAEQTIGTTSITFAAITGHTVGDKSSIYRVDEFDWTSDGITGNTGVAITGVEQTIGGASGPTITFAAIPGHMVGDTFTVEPQDSGFTQPAKILRLAGLAGTSVFQKYNKVTGLWEAITSNLKGLWYPQSIIYDVPDGPYFCWVDPQSGLHVYDGVTDTVQAIPKYDDGSGAYTGNITGALWLAQVDGRLIVAGNWTDNGQSNVLYYSSSGKSAQWESHNGGGALPLYGNDGSQVKRITGLTVLHGELIVFTEDGRFVISGIGTTNQVIENYPGYGCFSGKCIVRVRNRLYWWGKDGGYEWNGNEPIEIGQPIMPELFALKVWGSFKFFGFTYEDQWWTCVKRRDGGYRNFVFDFITRNWFVSNIPMTAAWSSLTGLVDNGFLYFASPEDARTDAELAGGEKAAYYKHYIYGVDPLNKYQPVYADKVIGDADARTGTGIAAYWIGGRLDFDNILMKGYSLLHARIGTAPSSTLTESSFTAARIAYNLDDDTTFSHTLDFTQAADTPYHALSFAGVDDIENVTYGTLLQLKLDVVGTKRLDLKKVYAEYNLKPITAHET